MLAAKIPKQCCKSADTDCHDAACVGVGKPLAVSYRHLAGGKKKQIDIQTVVFIRTRDEFACPITSHGRIQPF
jgi:hypothetical protein